MSETNESSTRSGADASGEWLTVSQAAAALGISERQARRDAKRLKADDRRDAGHNRQSAGHMSGHDAGHKSGSRPALVRRQALRDVRENAVPRSKVAASDIQTGIAPDTMPDMTAKVPDMAPDTIEPDAGHSAGHMTGALLSQLQSENAFLRAQIEAANRQAAEATAALREYLKMQAKTLPSGEARDQLDEVGQEKAAKLGQVGLEKAAKLGQVGTGAQSGLRGEGLRELRAILKTLFGVR